MSNRDMVDMIRGAAKKKGSKIKKLNIDRVCDICKDEGWDLLIDKDCGGTHYKYLIARQSDGVIFATGSNLEDVIQAARDWPEVKKERQAKRSRNG